MDKIKKRYHNFILINTNMGYGNHIRGDEFVESNYKGRFKNINQNIYNNIHALKDEIND